MSKGRVIGGCGAVGPNGSWLVDVREPDIEMDVWEVQVKGTPCSASFEISVIRLSDTHGHASWGWFGEKKLLISHNGGPCTWPLTRQVWDKQIKLAQEVSDELNYAEFKVIHTKGKE